ncbi:hypothetical protein AC1031_021105 [Aphanomyces cochlioides]|nr:hypothetical protein AC1031_021105 [Aphanomyces cochlioides]
MVHVVHFKWLSVVCCSIFVFNLVGTPFLTHIFEASPFEKLRQLPSAIPDLVGERNYSHRAYYARQIQMLYNASTIPAQARYYRDVQNMVDVMRTPVDCHGSSKQLSKIQGEVCFTPDAKQAIHHCIHHGLHCHNVTRSWCLDMMTIPISTSVLWLVPGDDGLNVNETSWTVYYAFVPQVNGPWLVAKFFFRLFVDIAILIRIVRSYAIPVWHLRTNLTQHRFHAASLAVRYEIKLGDPSCLVTSEPWICAAYVVDIWSNSEVVARAFLRVSQLNDWATYGLGLLCLGRMVWCSFALLVALNSVRKWFPHLRLYAPINLIVLVLLAILLAALLPLAQTPALVDGISWLFTIFSTFDSEGQTASMDNIVVVIVHFAIMCALPFAVAMISDCWYHPGSQCRCCSRKRRGCSISPSRRGPTTLDIRGDKTPREIYKTKNLSKRSARRSTFMLPSCGGVFTGDGGLAKLFEMHPLLRAQATLSQRGASCQVRAYDNRNNLVDDARVHLVSQINTKRALVIQTQDIQAAVGRLVLIDVEGAKPQNP